MTAVTVPGTTAPRRIPAIVPPSLPQLVRVELRKSYDTRAGRWLLLAIGLAALGVVAISLFVEDAPKTFADLFSFTQLPVGILLPVLGILLVTSEWSQRTAMTTFTLVPRRSRVLTAKVLAASVLAVLGVVAAAVASALGRSSRPVVTDQGSGLVDQRRPARARCSSCRWSSCSPGSPSACCCSARHWRS